MPLMTKNQEGYQNFHVSKQITAKGQEKCFKHLASKVIFRRHSNQTGKGRTLIVTKVFLINKFMEPDSCCHYSIWC